MEIKLLLDPTNESRVRTMSSHIMVASLDGLFGAGILALGASYQSAPAPFVAGCLLIGSIDVLSGCKEVRSATKIYEQILTKNNRQT